MTVRRAALGLILMVTLPVAACGRRGAPHADSAESARSSASRVSPDSDWVGELGEMLVVPADSDNAAVVLFPTSPSPRLVSSRPVTLFNTAGDSIATRVAMTPADPQQCGDAPIVHLRDVVRVPWSIGLQGQSVVVARLDSLEAMPSSDSARLAADLTRLASTIPVERASRFLGLPYVVLAARRSGADGRRLVLAHLVRRVNQEATPLEEHTLIIAERDIAPDAKDPYVMAYSERSEGPEDSAEHFEVLALLRAHESVLAFIARDQEARTEYEVLERPNGGRWRVRWRRVLAC